MLEEILDIRNVQKAFRRVTANKGAGGIDGMQTDELRDYLNANWQTLRSNILTGNFRPNAVRKVEIPKSGGGMRMLCIPTVIDRLIQQSIAQWLIPKYEGDFSAKSYGFRPKRNAHQAVLKAQEYLNTGYTWIVELDLDKFFDRVNHDKLMHLLSVKIKDKRTLKLIRLYLSVGIMENGLVSPRREGTPQGSPLSPLLSNVILDELDVKLEERGHSFVRYADDCSIYLRSKKSAERVMSNISSYLEKSLKLKVNREKSKVSKPTDSSLLGFSFYKRKGWQLRLSSGSVKKVKEKIRFYTQRKHSVSLSNRLRKLDEVIRGWVNYFSIATGKRVFGELDRMVRRRLRVILWKEWKNASNRMRNLIKLGISKSQSYQWPQSRKSYCRTANSKILMISLNNAYFSKMKYVGFEKYYYWKTKHQMKLF
ncbi:group II intron reverse transcriptase/maturase [Pedobacter sp. MC2016-05]|uniref:group II intron reverse transcriptase/maturase n=1 Tax=Pedobacter sp. MC2016-05 TaxID=2994474 RepID=UPI00224651F3|nr:group II intron reverse transcriptase/maturase [Pedobacter sp. MC2016-05]MCX2476978.1 group II intron reverse transcriptase/maturase [Pedobacter sp. MC2016-05]